MAVIVNNSDKDRSLDLAVPFPNGTRVVDVMTAAPVDFYQASARSLNFPDFEKSATMRALRFGPNAGPVHVVYDGKIHIGLSAKTAAILVKQ